MSSPLVLLEVTVVRALQKKFDVQELLISPTLNASQGGQTAQDAANMSYCFQLALDINPIGRQSGISAWKFFSFWNRNMLSN